MKALVAGASLGGLTTALGLHEIGIEVRVFESVEIIRPLGVGINRRVSRHLRVGFRDGGVGWCLCGLGGDDFGGTGGSSFSSSTSSFCTPTSQARYRQRRSSASRAERSGISEASLRPPRNPHLHGVEIEDNMLLRRSSLQDVRRGVGLRRR
jgi:hypothetical protein